MSNGVPVESSIFADLPEALVEEMLSNYRKLGGQLTASLQSVQELRTSMRDALKKQNLLFPESSIIRSLTNPF